jgi:hypothetical protein
MDINPLPTFSQASSTDPYGAFTSDRDGSEDDPRRDDVEQEEAPFATVADENDLLDELENEGDQEPEEDGEELFGDNFEEYASTGDKVAHYYYYFFCCQCACA